MSDNELMHYGVLGMKWGIRRYQNADGSLTAEGRRHAKQEYKADNKKAFELGKEAMINRQIKGIAKNQLKKAEAKLEKNPDSEKANTEYEIRKMLLGDAEKASAAADKAMNTHHAELVKKYGKDAVSNIKYDKYGNLNERAVTKGEIAASILFSGALSAVAVSAGVPFVVVTTPDVSGKYAGTVRYGSRYQEELAKRR